MATSFAKRLLVLIVSGVLMSATGAEAHPHVWVTVKTTVLFKGGAIVGLQQHWTFDEFYAAMAIEGLDKNNDGVYDRQELAPLAQVNMDGMKEFKYFTFAKLGDAADELSPPTDYWLEYTNKLLTLYFTLPLAKPVPATAKGLPSPRTMRVSSSPSSSPRRLPSHCRATFPKDARSPSPNMTATASASATPSSGNSAMQIMAAHLANRFGSNALPTKKPC